MKVRTSFSQQIDGGTGRPYDWAMIRKTALRHIEILNPDPDRLDEAEITVIPSSYGKSTQAMIEIEFYV